MDYTVNRLAAGCDGGGDAAAEERLQDVVRVHLAAFPGFFLARLGRRFLLEYYRCVCRYEHGLVLTAEREGRLIGFVAGFGSPAAFRAFMRARALHFAIPAAIGILRRPVLLGRFVAAYAGTGGTADAAAEANDTCELASLGVDPAYEGQGIGRALVETFCAAARASGARRVCLSTDARDNDRVNRFYRSLGFAPSHRERRSGSRVMQHYVRVLDG